MNKKRFSTHKSITVLLLTIIIFSLGIVVGNYNTSQKFSQVLSLSKNLQTQTLGAEVVNDILEENLCEMNNLDYLNDDLFALSERLGYMETVLGSENSQVVELKNDYFVIEARHWILTKRKNERCSNGDTELNETIVLYFYSNEGDCHKCKEQGSVLVYLMQKYKGMKIYSFDINADSQVVRVIKNVYDIEGTPGLIINDQSYVGYLNIEGFEQLVENQKLVE
ncbi:MAG: hypothetical protein KAQ83_00205 [Nanoarchaeota archaeon]|nr:hypothetical protein [Nanoarchaeota archaeon]